MAALTYTHGNPPDRFLRTFKVNENQDNGVPTGGIAGQLVNFFPNRVGKHGLESKALPLGKECRAQTCGQLRSLVGVQSHGCRQHIRIEESQSRVGQKAVIESRFTRPIRSSQGNDNGTLFKKVKGQAQWSTSTGSNTRPWKRPTVSVPFSSIRRIKSGWPTTG